LFLENFFEKSIKGKVKKNVFQKEEAILKPILIKVSYRFRKIYFRSKSGTGI